MSITLIPGTPEATSLGYRMLVNELAFEINSGMKWGRNYSPLNTAKQLGYRGPNRKVDALAWILNNLPIDPDILTDRVIEALATGGYVIEAA